MAHQTAEYSIQEASALLGIPVHKLRRWDMQGILVARRTAGGHRRYAKEVIDRLNAAWLAQATERDNLDELTAVKRALEEKRRIIQLLLESEQRYRDLVETSHDLIWSTDAQGRFTYLNNAATDIFGLVPNELLGRCFFDFEVDSAYVANRRFLSILKNKGETLNYVTRIVRADGSERWVGINARTTADSRGITAGIRGTARDITEQHLATQRIEHLATHDPLTDLPNRLSLQQALDQLDDSEAVGAVIFLDMDHLKYINDHLGQPTGDRLILGIAGVLKSVLEPGQGEVYRTGGDEFAVHLPQARRSDAVAIAERILAGVRHYSFRHPETQRPASITVSLGIALYPFHGNDALRLFANADIALYQAKEQGRNRYVLFDQDLHNLRSIHHRIHWDKKLRAALDQDRLVLYVQPVVRLSDQKVVHHEVLVRMIDEDGKIIAPGEFIEIAESLGIIREIDLRVVEKLLAHIKRLPAASVRRRYFVNLSRVSISDQQWITRFHHVLAAAKVEPSSLVFEITETAAMSEVNVTLSFIRQLKTMGCRFALDDFGAGFSSFYYLKRFDVDYLKIDGSFIRDLTTDEANQVFVKALVDVAHGLRKQVIAECVEHSSELEVLHEMGVQFVQGYYFARPQPLQAAAGHPAAGGSASGIRY